MKALDGRTPYEMLHDMKPDLADWCAFGAPCAIVGPSEKLHGLWAGLQASAGRMRYLGNALTSQCAEYLEMCLWRCGGGEEAGKGKDPTKGEKKAARGA